MPEISKRGQKVPMSPFRKLVPYADIAKANGKHVYHLNIGQPDIQTPPEAMAAIRNIDLDVLAYGPAAGNLSYRQKLVPYYQVYDMQVAPEHIVIGNGASECLQILMFACFNHNDEIIVPEPFYANYNGFAQIADVNIRPLTCNIEDGFALPPIEAFEKAITPKTKGIVITNPNNPTGAVYSQEVLEQLGALAKKHDLYLICDEVYREFCFDDTEFYSILNLRGLEEHTIIIDSISKRYSACGARVGAIVTKNEALLNTLTRYVKLRLSPPGLGQILAEASLEMESQYMDDVQAEYDRRRMTVFNRLQQMEEVISYKPSGAFYCFAKFPIDDADRFCQWLLEDFEHNGATVMLSPGAGFYATPGLGKDEVRMAFVLNIDDLNEAMDCLQIALAKYPGRVAKQEILAEK